MKITLTGADERTRLLDIAKLIDEDARTEVAFLYTFDPEGRNRYPSLNWILSSAQRLGGIINTERLAVHVCGKRALGQLQVGVLDQILGRGARLDARIGRLQINGEIDAASLAFICREYPWLQIITQEGKIVGEWPNGRPGNHIVLVDGSGGQGILPSKWVRPTEYRPVGFAGGLSKNNLREELPKIMAVSRNIDWIDMESSLRSKDWFDYNIAMETIGKFQCIVDGIESYLALGRKAISGELL